MNLTIIDFLLIALAGYRLAHLLVYEDAPFALAKRLRARTTLGGLLSCVWCAGFWMCLLAYLALRFGDQVGYGLVLVLAANAGGLMLASFSGASRE